MKVLHVMGTRPEVIKFAPVIKELKQQGIEQITCFTGQQNEMARQMLDLFELKADYDLKIMSHRQTLEKISSELIAKLPVIMKLAKPTLVLVQGDTTSALMGAVAAFYHKIPVGHIEAGLRSYDKFQPFPEEFNRRTISLIADLHFAPTKRAAQNLEGDRVDRSQIFVTGNTVIDALLWVLETQASYSLPVLQQLDPLPPGSILVTCHRRENAGQPMAAVFRAIAQLALADPRAKIIFPVHLNPDIQALAHQILAKHANIKLLPPLSYSDLARVLQQITLVLTDSGGIQEEAPALGKPVLVLRQTTERPEGLEAGTAQLVGTGESDIVKAARRLLESPTAYQKMARATNPYGDGRAASKIVKAIKDHYVGA